MRALLLALALALVAGTATAATPAEEQAAMAQRLFEQARALENEGKYRGAMSTYRLAARNGHGKAARRLGELYAGAAPGLEKDRAEALKWYNAARLLGEPVPRLYR
jgi:TPR repeat protein